MSLPYKILMEFAQSSVDHTTDQPYQESIIQAILAVAFSNMAVAQELKKFNDEAELERERIDKNVKDLGW